MNNEIRTAGSTRRVILSLIIFYLMSGVGSVARAQEGNVPEVNSAQPALHTYKVTHDHRIGAGAGELRITETGIEYRGASADEARHSRVWRDDDIKRLEISKAGLRVVAYEPSVIPLIPRRTPKVREGKSVRVGNERDYEFRLVKSEVTPDVVRELLTRFKRPVMTSVIPNEDAESGKLLFEIPVFHRRFTGGESGILRVYEGHVIFAAEGENGSRHWRYPDIRDIGKLGRYKFEIATYEGQFGTDGRSYIFDLKREMTSAEYDQLWTRIYELELSPRLRPVSNKKL